MGKNSTLKFWENLIKNGDSFNRNFKDQKANQQNIKLEPSEKVLNKILAYSSSVEVVNFKDKSFIITLN